MHHIHASLQKSIYVLTDLEFLALGKVTFSKQDDVLAKLLGSEAVGPRLLGTSRIKLLQDKVKEDLWLNLSDIDDKQFFELSKVPGPFQQEMLEGLASRREARTIFSDMSRYDYIQQQIQSDLRYSLAGLSDGAVFVLGTVQRKIQEPLLKDLQRYEEAMTFNRSALIKKRIYGSLWGKKLSPKTDLLIKRLSNKHWDLQLKLMAADTPGSTEPATEQDKGIESIPMNQNFENEASIVLPIIESADDASQAVTNFCSSSIQLIAVTVKGQILRSGCIHLMYAVKESGESIVLNIEALSKGRSRKSLFDEILPDLKALLESPRCIKVFYDCRAASDVLFH